MAHVLQCSANLHQTLHSSHLSCTTHDTSANVFEHTITPISGKVGVQFRANKLNFIFSKFPAATCRAVPVLSASSSALSLDAFLVGAHATPASFSDHCHHPPSLSVSRRKIPAVPTPNPAQSCCSQYFRLFYLLIVATATRCFYRELYVFP